MSLFLKINAYCILVLVLIHSESLFASRMNVKSHGEFKRWVHEYVNADDSVKAGMEKKGLELARRRKAEISALIRSQPEVQFETVISFSDASRLPVAIAKELE